MRSKGWLRCLRLREKLRRLAAILVRKVAIMYDIPVELFMPMPAVEDKEI